MFYITKAVGTLCVSFALLNLLPMATEMVYGHHFWPFLISAIWSGVVGAFLYLVHFFYTTEKDISIKESFLITIISWFFLCALASIPLIIGNNNFNVIDAIFEAVSAITGTGASIILNPEKISHGVLIWRAILQWVGGIGIMVIALVLLPFLRVGGMQIFRSEFSDKSAIKVMPKISQITKSLLLVYSFFTIACAILLFKAGMGVFDAIFHGLTVVSTGGFSTKSQSIASFNSPLIELICIPFMIIGGCNLILFIQVIKGNVSKVLQDSQLRMYLLIVFLAMVIFLFGTGRIDNHRTIIKDLFNAVSIVTTSGFASEDYTLNSSFIIMFIIWTSLIGGCTGSTAGGIKVFRIQIIQRQISASLRKMCRPNAVVTQAYNNEELQQDTFLSISTYLSLFVLTFFLSTLALAWFGMSPFDAFSTTISSITNLGPAFNTANGPLGNFASLNVQSKVVMMVVMVLGRLEFVTIIVIFTRGFWR